MIWMKDEFEDTKGIIISVNRRTKGQTTIYKTPHRKLTIEQHEPHKKPGVISGVLDE